MFSANMAVQANDAHACTCLWAPVSLKRYEKKRVQLTCALIRFGNVSKQTELTTEAYKVVMLETMCKWRDHVRMGCAKIQVGHRISRSDHAK